MFEEIKDTGRYYVEAKEGPLDGQTFEVAEGGLTVGRSSDCGVVLSDKSISRRHARFYIQDGYCYIEDTGSRNGFLVKGQRTQFQCLRNGDVVDVGCCKLIFHSEGTWRERATPDAIAEEVKELEEEAKRPREVLVFPLHPYALTALVFGALTFLFWGFAVGALVLAVLAAVDIRRKGHHRGTPLAAGAVVLAVMGLSTHWWLASGGFWLVRGGSPAEDACRQNLMHIEDALSRYAQKNEGRYPKSLEELYPAYVRRKERLSCPGISGSSEVGRGYAFPAAGRDDLPGDAVALCDSSMDNHGGRGGFVLRVSGQVEWLSAEEMERLLADLEER